VDTLRRKREKQRLKKAKRSEHLLVSNYIISPLFMVVRSLGLDEKHTYLKVHKREKFYGSDFEFFTIL
jgi:hypothetical protein